jgi:hypothetical protein
VKISKGKKKLLTMSTILRKINDFFEQSGHKNYLKPLKIIYPLLPVKKVTPEMLPLNLKPWLADIADRMQVPISFPTVAALVATATLIGTRLRMQPKQDDDSWHVVPNLWGVIIGNPGMNKSDAFKEPLSFLKNQEAKDFQVYEEDMKEYRTEKQVFEAKTAAIRAKMKNKTSDHLGLEEELKQHLQNEPEEPTCKRYLLTDATKEKAVEVNGHNPQGLLLYYDEIAGLFARISKEQNREERTMFLSAWSGDQSYTVDRIKRGTQVVAPLCFSILGTIQPDVFENILLNYVYKSSDGLVQRIQLLVFPDPIAEHRYIDKKPDKEAEDQAMKIFKRIHDQNFIEHLSMKCGEKNIIMFSPEAQELFVEFYNRLMAKVTDPDTDKLIKQHLSKYRSLMPSLALIFHTLDCDESNNVLGVSVHATKLAIEWCELLETHAERVYQMAGKTAPTHVKVLAEKILAKRVRNHFNRNDIQQYGFAHLKDLEEIEHAIGVLEEHHWLIKLEPEYAGTGRHPNPIYKINPRVYELK